MTKQARVEIFGQKWGETSFLYMSCAKFLKSLYSILKYWIKQKKNRFFVIFQKSIDFAQLKKKKK